MKRVYKTLPLTIAVFCALALVGCGKNRDVGSENATTGYLSPGQFGTMDGGNNSTQENTGDMGNNANQSQNAGDNVADGVGDAVGDVANGVGNAVDDVADGVGDAVDNLGGGSFDSYDDAKDYLLGKLSEDNVNATYEIRNEKRDLVSYHSEDSGAQGYQFSVYETDGNEKIGIYYVDKETGKIYRYMGKNSIEGY